MFIQMQGIINFRDLGGLHTESGRRVCSGKLFRCGELHKASDGDILCLSEELRIRHIVDFRSPDEASERPNASVPGAQYHIFPALPPMVQPKDRMKNGPPEDAEAIFPRIYRELAETEAAQHAYRRFFDVLLEAKGEGVLWHCRQGKDRTGIAAILLLSALGVSREECIQEYLLTNEYMLPVYEAYCQKETEVWKRNMMRIISLVYEPWLANYFMRVDEDYGGMENYLQNVLHVTEGQRQLLRRYYLQ